jgi:hypothetical protein
MKFESESDVMRLLVAAEKAINSAATKKYVIQVYIMNSLLRPMGISWLPCKKMTSLLPTELSLKKDARLLH